jgi:putative colanic acid biosynthesis glycosyltransferase
MEKNKSIWFINGYQTGSTGKIINDLIPFFEDNEYSTLTIEPGNKECTSNTYHMNTSVLRTAYRRGITHLFGIDGFSNAPETKSLLQKFKNQKPSIISLHNIHPYFISLPLIIRFSLDNNIPILWTLHDQWVLSGRCCCFQSVHCEKWKTKCGHCPFMRNYPKALFDNSRHIWLEKRKLISENKNVVFVAPSFWMKASIENPCSGYKNRCVMIKNPVDLSSFAPSKPNDSIKEKAKGRICLGFAAYQWSEEKGSTILKNLSMRLDPSKYCFFVAGLPDDTLANNLPANMFLLGRISSKKELAIFYSSIDYFINPTMQDNAPMVNIESLACGTPIITFRTGGAAECVFEGKNGFSIMPGDVASLINKIVSAPQKKFLSDSCIKSVENYGVKKSAMQYVSLANELLGKQ